MAESKSKARTTAKQVAKKRVRKAIKNRTKKKTKKAASKRVTRQSVVAALHSEDYRKSKQLGSSALPYLRRVVAGDDWNLATKAVYLAGLLNDDDSVAIVELAAKSRRPALRVAAAGAAAHLSAERAEPVLRRLLKSRVVGIRKWAIKATQSGCTEKVYAIVDRLQRDDTNDDLRSLARKCLKQARR